MAAKTTATLFILTNLKTNKQLIKKKELQSVTQANYENKKNSIIANIKNLLKNGYYKYNKK